MSWRSVLGKSAAITCSLALLSAYIYQRSGGGLPSSPQKSQAPRTAEALMPGPKSAPVLHAVRGADTMIGPALPAPDTSLTTRPDPMVAPVTRGARHAPVSI